MYIITVDIDKCQACGDCVDFCAIKAMVIVEENGKKHAIYKGKPEDCLGCLSCQEGCMDEAVTVTEV